jgi:hypothetical protein
VNSPHVFADRRYFELHVGGDLFVAVIAQDQFDDVLLLGRQFQFVGN